MKEKPLVSKGTGGFSVCARFCLRAANAGILDVRQVRRWQAGH
jgi:hypothetical protein